MTQARSDEPQAVVPSDMPVACAHCGLPVPTGLLDLDREEQFCCAGCRGVYDLIRGLGMDSYYKLRDQLGETGQPVGDAREAAFDAFDDPVFLEKWCRPREGGLLETQFSLEGIHCAACVWLLERLPSMREGVQEARVELRRKRLTVSWDASALRLSALASFLHSLGYTPHAVRDHDREREARNEDRRYLIRIAIAGVCAGNVMLIAFALYGGMFSGMASSHAALFRWTSLALGTVALFWPGAVFLRGAYAAVRARVANLDMPIALGLVAGWVSGAVNTVTASGEIYFDTVTMLIFLLLVGRWIQHRQQRRASDALGLLFGLTPTTARLVGEDGVVRQVPIEALAVDQAVEVRPGETVPVDGVVTSGHSEVDRSLMTGETEPELVDAGEEIQAGVVNLTSTIRLRVNASGDETRVAQLMRMVEESSTRNVGVVQRADRIARWFVVVVIISAVATFVGWAMVRPGVALDHAMTLLIVTCPCALALATPLAIVASVGRAAQRGILIRNGNALESLAGRGTVYLDKTGTLTEGRPGLCEWHGSAETLALASAAEAHSSHPVARAIVAACEATEEAESSEHVIGGGVRAMVGGRRVLVGSVAFVTSEGAHVGDEERARIERINRDGRTAVVVCVGGVCEGIGALEDPIRLDAKAAVDSLRALGLSVGILSGDHPSVVRRVAERLGIEPGEARGGMSPEDKLDAVRAHEGRVVMVGDGINDAAALAEATVGVAVHGGAEASLSAADVYTSTPGLRPLVDLVEGSRRTSSVIGRNLAVSLGYNVVCATLAIAGLINPIIAAVLMPLSSVTVLVLSYRTRTFGGGD